MTSAIDISDGLAANLWQISRMSEVGLVIDLEKIPIDEETINFAKGEKLDFHDLALFGGEDFELLFTVKSEAWSDLEDEFQRIGTKISKIGIVNQKKGVYLRKGEKIEGKIGSRN